MGIQLKTTREAVGKTQAEVAKYVGMSERGYRKLEIKEEYNAIQKAIRIADFLQIKTYKEFKELFGRTTQG